MNGIWFLLWLGLTLLIAYHNASVIGRWWTESKEIGGMVRFMVWMGAIMATCGFFVAYVSIITLGMGYFGLIPVLGQALGVVVEPATEILIIQTVFDIAYLMIIFPLLGSGLAIWAHSIVVAWHHRDAKSIGVAAWNTFAQARNTVNAIKFVPKTARRTNRSIRKLGKNAGGAAYLIILLLPIVISLGLAIWTVVVIGKAADAEYTYKDMA